MSNYNLKAAFTSFVKRGAYLARDLVPLDKITDSRVDRWRSSAMFLVRVGKRLFKEIDERDAEIKEMRELLERQDKKLRQCATIIYKHHPELYDEIRGEIKIYATVIE